MGSLSRSTDHKKYHSFYLDKKTFLRFKPLSYLVLPILKTLPIKKHQENENEEYYYFVIAGGSCCSNATRRHPNFTCTMVKNEPHCRYSYSCQTRTDSSCLG